MKDLLLLGSLAVVAVILYFAVARLDRFWRSIHLWRSRRSRSAQGWKKRRFCAMILPVKGVWPRRPVHTPQRGGCPMEKQRQDPDQLLRAIRNESGGEGRGKLKIFFGYAAGVGKTYAMLQAAHQARDRGVDVVAGYIEPHARPQTTALLQGLELLPQKSFVMRLCSCGSLTLTPP